MYNISYYKINMNTIYKTPDKMTNIQTVCSCYATYPFQSEFTLYSCLNVKERLA